MFERLSELDVRARARAGLIDIRTAALLQRHGLADGMLRHGSRSGACEVRIGGARHVFDYAALTGAAHHIYPQQLLVADLIDALRMAGLEVCFRLARGRDPALRPAADQARQRRADPVRFHPRL